MLSFLMNNLCTEFHVYTYIPMGRKTNCFLVLNLMIKKYFIKNPLKIQISEKFFSHSVLDGPRSVLAGPRSVDDVRNVECVVEGKILDATLFTFEVTELGSFSYSLKLSSSTSS